MRRRAQPPRYGMCVRICPVTNRLCQLPARKCENTQIHFRPVRRLQVHLLNEGFRLSEEANSNGMGLLLLTCRRLSSSTKIMPHCMPFKENTMRKKSSPPISTGPRLLSRIRHPERANKAEIRQKLVGALSMTMPIKSEPAAS